MKQLLFGLVLLLATATFAQQGQPPPAVPPQSTPPTFPEGSQVPPQQMPPDQNAPSQELSTAEVQQQIQEGLKAEPALRDSNVRVRVDETSVVLTGTVDSEEQHEVVLRIAQSYAGDREIVDDINLAERTSAAKRDSEGPMKIKEIMSRDPACCVPSDSAQKVAKILCDRNIGSLPVVSDHESRKLVGMITDRDLCCSVIAQGMDPKTTPIEKFITLAPFTCREGENIETCERLMQEHQVRRIPIVDAKDRVIGIVLQADLALKDKPERVSKTVAEISKAPNPRSQRKLDHSGLTAAVFPIRMFR